MDDSLPAPNKTPLDPRQALIRALAAQLVFFLQAFAFASWLTRLPAIKQAFDLSEGEVGALLVALPIGAVIASPLAGAASVWLPLRILNVLSLTWMVSFIALIGYTSDLRLLAVILFFVGLGAGAIGVAMNTAAIATEKAIGRPILMRCHAMFSIGLAAGALVATGFVSANISTALHLTIVAAIIVGLVLLVARWLPDERADAQEKGAGFSLPEAAVVIPALIACGSMIAEGATMDWAAIFLRTVLASPPEVVGLGVAAFSSAMAGVRFFGDRVISRFQDRQVLGTAALLGATGYAVVTVSPGYPLALAGYALIGLGLAPIMPTAFRLAGKLSPSAPAIGVAAASSAATVGFLLGPALIGFLAELSGLRSSFGMVCLLLAGVALLSRRV